jgi:triacylglycerol esterase/lipase EstA (alpha/beta hydrolase family)
MSRKLLGAVGVVIAVLVAGLAGSGTADAHGNRRGPRPVIFVHGGSGSGAQFDTQALRLTSNGYPADRIAVHEYDSTFGTNTMEQVWAVAAGWRQHARGVGRG